MKSKHGLLNLCIRVFRLSLSLSLSGQTTLRCYALSRPSKMTSDASEG